VPRFSTAPPGAALFDRRLQSTADVEDEANTFAADFLIPPRKFAGFSRQVPFSKARITAFAQEIGIAPGIVVGRLQHDGLLQQSHCNELKRRFEWTLSDA
jgi:HTH-type transcriptional regulator/antitoxin HigA